jgi:lipopolysaccharide/colanic/teichoic acid biosynthesis glycosyltransferase
MLQNLPRRAFDVVAALLLLLITLPAILLFAIGVAISLRTWPFFGQTRVGRDGAPFRFLKLRTLPPTAPRYASKYDIAAIEAPRFCRMLRSLHLDELPQLFLVLTGKMSLVGPRPEMPAMFESYPESFATARVSVRPGCTGLWQVSADGNKMISEHPEYDEFYVRNRSMRLDLWILLRTVKLMAPMGRGSFGSLDELPAWAFSSARPERTVNAPVHMLPAAHDYATADLEMVS